MNGAVRYVTINCRRVFKWYPHVGPAERITHAALACTRAAALLLPLALPGAAPPWGYGGVPYDYPRPAFAGPAYSPFISESGGLFAPGVYGMPLRDAPSRLAAGPAAGMAAEVGAVTPIAGDESSPPNVVTIATPLDVPAYAPGRDTPTSVPEPSSWALLATAGFILALCRLSRVRG